MIITMEQGTFEKFQARNFGGKNDWKLVIEGVSSTMKLVVVRVLVMQVLM